MSRSAAVATPTDATAREEYLTVPEVATRFKLSSKTVRNHMYDGTWRRGEHWFSRPGIGPRFKWSALVRWLEGGDVQRTDDGLAYGPDIPRDRPRQNHVDAAPSAVV